MCRTNYRKADQSTLIASQRDHGPGLGAGGWCALRLRGVFEVDILECVAAPPS